MTSNELVNKYGVKVAAWIPLGCVYNLREEYKNSYNLAHLYIREDGMMIKAELQSNWNSTYNTEEIKSIHHFGGSAIDAIRYYEGK